MGKVYLFGAAISAGYVYLAVLALINSAIAAWYYLRIVTTCYMLEATDPQQPVAPLPVRSLAAVASAVGVIALSLATAPLISASAQAAERFLAEPKNQWVQPPPPPQPPQPLPPTPRQPQRTGLDGQRNDGAAPAG